MASSADVMVRFLADTSQVDKGVSGMTGTLKKFGGGLTSFLGGAALGAFAKSAIDAASDLQESMNKVDTIFGKSAGEIRKFTENAAEDFGLSRQAALDAAGSFGNMFTQIGFTTDGAAKMSEGMIQLVADLASFHNADPSAVLEATQAAFRGEYDAMQKYIPTISAATVEHQALIDTGKTSADQLTQGEKAAAAYKIMIEQAGAATGDHARTAGDAANQQNTMNAKMQDTSATIGQALAPAMAIIVPMIADLAQAFSDAAPAIQNATIMLGGFAAVGIVIGGTVGAIVAAVGLVVVAAYLLWTNWDTVWNWIVNHPALALILTILFAPIAIFVLLIGALRTLYDNWDAIWTSIKNVTSAAVEFVKGLWHGLVDVITGIPGAIAGAFGGLWEILTAPFRTAETTIRGVFDTIKGIVRDAIGIVKGIWNPIANTVNDIVIKTPGVSLPFVGEVIPATRIDPFPGDLPTLAKGGVVSSATLALIGEAGPEAVVPLRDGMFGGNVYNIAIKVDAGTPPAVVGAAVVDQIRAYERVAGRAWRDAG